MGYNLQSGKFMASKVTNFASYTKNQPFSIDLIQDNNITLLYGTLKVNYSVPAASTPPTGPIEDGASKLVNDFKIQYGGGSGTPMKFLDLQQGVYYGNHLFGGALRNDQPEAPVAGGSKTAYVDFVFCPGLKPMDMQRPLYALPGESPLVSSMELAGTWGSPSDMFSTVNDVQIDSAQISIGLQARWGFSPNTSAMRKALGVDGNGYVPMPLYTAGNQDVNQTVSSLGLTLELPTDVIIRKIFLMVKDSNDDLSDSVVSELAIQSSAEEDIFGKIDFPTWQRYKAETMDVDAYTGCVMIDCVNDVRDTKFAKKDVGLELAKQEKLRIAYSTDAQGRIDYLFDTVRKVKVF